MDVVKVILYEIFVCQSLYVFMFVLLLHICDLPLLTICLIFYMLTNLLSLNQELSVTQQKSQLELYFDEPRVVDAKSKLDILSFWRVNSFAELARMAFDILSIPVYSGLGVDL